MKFNILILLFIIEITNIKAQYSKIEWVSTTEKTPWLKHQAKIVKKPAEKNVVELHVDKSLQTLEGFGACFNELGWISLNKLSVKDRNGILKELFAPNYGANFNICRMPVGANDFSRDWYSYNETDGDFEMAKFSIANDQQTLIPFIKSALKYNPKIKLWASPWSPPSWMKWNKHYACSVSSEKLAAQFQNNLKDDKQGKECSNMFIQQEKYLKSYALYFSKFIQEYRNNGINISTVMPQNEFNSCQIFPSCTWTAKALAEFIGVYLGPEMEKQKVEIMFGTMERPAVALVDTILKDKLASKYVKGVGFQWAGKEAISGIHKSYPDLKLYQTEQECGDGKNDWNYCCYAWDLMKHYFKNGASAYMYWNISLEKGGFSRWGWQQNSLITVDAASKTYHYNYEYYLMKHFSHYIKPGARLIETSGEFDNLLAFVNPDKSVVLVAQNETNKPLELNFTFGESSFSCSLDPLSFNTILINSTKK
jgi:glucosylceramidase